jgi:hypothetical protein
MLSVFERRDEEIWGVVAGSPVQKLATTSWTVRTVSE